MQSLVNVDWLREMLGHQDLVVLDASTPTNVAGLIPKYTDKYIPGSRYFDLKNDFSDMTNALPNTLPSADHFEKQCQNLGINQKSIIVVYDNLGIYSSPRVWWMFHAMGHENVAVLDGGFPAWVEAGLKTEVVYHKNIIHGDFIARLSSEKLKSPAQILAELGNQEMSVIDARSEDRFLGMTPEPRPGMRSGHIPKSINIPFEEVLDNGRYKSQEQLKLVFDQKGVENQFLTFSCGSGLTACIVLLAAQMSLNNQTALYDGSWAEWGQLPQLPIE